jgi:hypothetical protein
LNNKNLIVKLKRPLVITVLADVRLAERSEVEVAPLLRVQDHVAAIGRVGKLLVGLKRFNK